MMKHNSRHQVLRHARPRVQGRARCESASGVGVVGEDVRGIKRGRARGSWRQGDD